MPMGTLEPFALSRWTRSTWITHFLRYTWVTLPSRPLYFPRTIRTSSSFRTGSDRAYPNETCKRMDRVRGQKIAYMMLVAQLLRQRRRHDYAADRRRRGEVLLARFAPGGRNIYGNAGFSTLVSSVRISRHHLIRRLSIHLKFSAITGI